MGKLVRNGGNLSPKAVFEHKLLPFPRADITPIRLSGLRDAIDHPLPTCVCNISPVDVSAPRYTHPSLKCNSHYNIIITNIHVAYIHKRSATLCNIYLMQYPDHGPNVMKETLHLKGDSNLHSCHSRASILSIRLSRLPDGINLLTSTCVCGIS